MQPDDLESRSSNRSTPVTIALGPTWPIILREVVESHPLLALAAHARSPAIAVGPASGDEFSRSIGDLVSRKAGMSVDLPVLEAGRHGVRGTSQFAKRSGVDVDAIAPRLREVQLPTALAHADFLLAAVDLRARRERRPQVVLGLWTHFAPLRHRLGARLTGPREGLTAELGLAVRPSAFIVVDRLFIEGPIIALIGYDPIAIELIALAIRQLQRQQPVNVPGPWEDQLVQRAVELGLGVNLPSQIAATFRPSPGLDEPGRISALKHLRVALDRIGVPQREPFS